MKVVRNAVFLDVCYELHAFWSRAFQGDGRLDACSFSVSFWQIFLVMAETLADVRVVTSFFRRLETGFNDTRYTFINNVYRCHLRLVIMQHSPLRGLIQDETPSGSL
jgi:hypothetical protein